MFIYGVSFPRSNNQCAGESSELKSETLILWGVSSAKPPSHHPPPATIAILRGQRMLRMRNDCGTRGRGRGRWRCHCIIIRTMVVGALAFVFIPVARNQKHQVAQVFVVIWSSPNRKRLGKNLSPVVDVEGIRYLQARARTYELVQIAHRPSLFPDKRMQKIHAV